MEINLEKVKTKKHVFGKLSFIIGVFPFLYLICLSIIDIFISPNYSVDNGKTTVIIINIVACINIIGMIFGIASLYKNGYKRNLAIQGITLNSIVPTIIVIIRITYFIKIIILKRY